MATSNLPAGSLITLGLGGDDPSLLITAGFGAPASPLSGPSDPGDPGEPEIPMEYLGGELAIIHRGQGRSQIGIATVRYEPAIVRSIRVLPGTGGAQAETVGSVVIDLSDGPVDLDIDSGQLRDGLNASVALTSFIALTLSADAANSGPVTVETAIANGNRVAIDGTLTLHPGAAASIQSPSSGYHIDAGTGDLIRFSGPPDARVRVIVTGRIS